MSDAADLSDWHYVANGPIYFGGRLAFERDDPVPKANAETSGYEPAGLVRREAWRPFDFSAEMARALRLLD